MEVGTTQIRPDGPAQVGAPGLNELSFGLGLNELAFGMEISSTPRVNIRRHTSVSDISGGQSVGEKLRANAAAVVIKEITRTEQSKCEEDPGGRLFSQDNKKMKIDLSGWRNAYSVLQAKQDSIENKNNEELFTMG